MVLALVVELSADLADSCIQDGAVPVGLLAAGAPVLARALALMPRTLMSSMAIAPWVRTSAVVCLCKKSPGALATLTCM